MSPVASAPTDSTAPVAGVLRRRGKSKAPNFSYSGPVSVIRLELDASDDRLRRRLDHQWAAVFRLWRALQRDAVSRCRAYWASRGRRHGPPRIGSWWDFTRIPGRARSHTKTRPVWETWRLTGTLDGHLAAHRHPRLPQTVSTARAAAAQPAGTSILAQLARLPAPDKPASGSWWDHDGALAVVLTGLPGGDVVLPVRLPQGAGQWEHLCHFLADPTVWHKIDLVRVRDRHAAGGWRYYAHLLTHQRGYGSASTKVRRSAVPDGRSAGVDANVSNLSVASFPTQHTDDPTQHTDDLVVEQITLINEQQQAAEQAARRARVRQRALDRSRPNTNPDQYGPARSRSQAKYARARQTAAAIVAVHSNTITVEDCAISTWARLWGKRIQLFSSGMLVAALAAECAATGGQLQRAATRTTALSQHCLCGQRVPKALAQRAHHCPDCGLRASRDIVSAVLAACVELADPEDPATARVDYTRAHALRAGLASQQEERAQSTGTSHQQERPVGQARTGSHHRVVSAEQAIHHSAHPRTDQHHWTPPEQSNTKPHKRIRWKQTQPRVNS